MFSKLGTPRCCCCLQTTWIRWCIHFVYLRTLYRSQISFSSIHAGGYTQSVFSLNSERTTVDPVEYHCNGQENNLQSCDNQASSICFNHAVTTIACVRRNASGIIVMHEKKARVYEFIMLYTLYVFTISDACSSGDLRLWGGQAHYEGNIELCTDHGVWSAVCDSNWGFQDAAVVCKQLNYTNSSKKASNCILKH